MDRYTAPRVPVRSPSTVIRPSLYASPKPISGSNIKRRRVLRSRMTMLATGEASLGETAAPFPRVRRMGGRPTDSWIFRSSHSSNLEVLFRADMEGLSSLGPHALADVTNLRAGL